MRRAVWAALLAAGCRGVRNDWCAIVAARHARLRSSGFSWVRQLAGLTLHVAGNVEPPFSDYDPTRRRRALAHRAAAAG
eukprot:gene12941-10785_t